MEVKGTIVGYRCVSCGREQTPGGVVYTCPDCGGNLDVVYDHDAIRRSWTRDKLDNDQDQSLWRYLPILPVNSAPDNRSIRVGGTPLIVLKEGARRFGLDYLMIKDDTRLPSGSLKDRASEVGLRHAAENGRNVLVAASTGNAAASLACLAAWHGMKAVILAPSSAPPAKLTQILQYGAHLVPVDGTYDDAFDLSLEVAKQFGWYCRSTGINPTLSEGKKTVALEIAEQCGWNVPDMVFVPVGDGCIIGGVYKGFLDLQKLGWIDRIPQIAAVQSTESSAVVDAIERGGEIVPVQSTTIADSISVNLPRDGVKAVRAVLQSGGFGLRVDDDEILGAQHDLASSHGIFGEPAAAAAWAGLVNVSRKGLLEDIRSAVVLVTGTGLKDVASAQKRVSIPQAVRPEVAAVEKALKEAGL